MRRVTQKEGRHSTHRTKTRRVVKEETGKQSNAWPVY